MKDHPRKYIISKKFDANVKDNIRFKTIDIWIFHQAGYTYEEIAKLLRISTNTVGKAVKKVENHLENMKLEDLLILSNGYVKVE